MPKLPAVKPEKLLKALKGMGFYKFHQVGSHIQMKHADGRRVTLPFHKGKEIRRGTLRGIINDLGLTVDEFTIVLKG